MQEAVGRDLLQQPLAWPLARRLRRRQRFSTERLPLVDHSLRIDHFAYFEAHDFQPDKLSEGVAKRNEFEQTYARPMRPKTDNELPGDVLEAIQYNHMPQFNLRNIGRAERSADPEEPLPFARQKGLGGDFGAELDEVRAAGVPKVVVVIAAASMAPTMTMAEMALVTAINGVCKAGVTVQTTW